jgi:hypothetical protein
MEANSRDCTYIEANTNVSLGCLWTVGNFVPVFPATMALNVLEVAFGMLGTVGALVAHLTAAIRRRRKGTIRVKKRCTDIE